ncbi:hypothetical protein IEQ34_014265 [Dendrobium chrysotoxum]|uniref:DUF4283 domain-containing protein n=1 Tax=Dendrobium chrysotoxum TaxID=161865 RepID=A0AAV7GL22_DENCH|nr:hypothetical protein IEQ34_014265 [Dendrobium chrysotoxum]
MRRNIIHTNIIPKKTITKSKLSGEFSVTLLDEKYVPIQLANDLDYYRVFMHRSYFVNNCFMKLVKWSPYLDLMVESPILPIWVSFLNLRPRLFSPRILNGLGSLFGRPLCIDNATVVELSPFDCASSS